MRSKLLSALGLAAYLGLLVGLFAFSANMAFSLFVRSGATTTPDLAGLSRDEAEALLAEQGLAWSVARSEGRYSDAVPVGSVVGQKPSPGSLVKRGNVVEVVLSLGPQRLTVPDLRGQSVASAQVALAGAALTLGKTLHVFSSEDSPGNIVRQFPESGAATGAGTAVDILIAEERSGETYVMPDLVYAHIERVRSFFDNHGLRIGTVRAERYEGVPAGVILRQSPLPGHPLSRTDLVSLVIASDDPNATPLNSSPTP